MRTRRWYSSLTAYSRHFNRMLCCAFHCFRPQVPRPMMRCLLVTSLMVLAASRNAIGQPLRVTATTPMDFGTLAPLFTRLVTPASAQAAVFSIQGQASSTINVLVVTPDQLVGSTQWVKTSLWNATVTTLFGTSPSAIPLVPGSELTITLGTDGLATLRVGATLAPPMTVGSGTFSSVVTVVARDATNGLMSLTAQNAVSAIIRQPLVLTAVPMQFGSVYVNTPKTLTPTDVNAFRMLVDGAIGTSVDVTLESVPASLARSGGGSTLAIGSWQVRSGGAACSGSLVTPTVGAAVMLDLNSPVGANGRSSYCLGATITPTALQTSGNYSGTVVISVRYTGA
jgi:hypothetical protein